VHHPWPMDFGEGPTLDQALRLARGENLYPPPPLTSSWTVTNYPPLVALLQAPLVLLFGPALWYGRLLSLLAVLVAAGCVGGIVRRLGGDRFGAWIAGGTLLAIPYVQHWASLDRVDGPALGLACGALYVLVRAPTRGRTLWLAAALLVAAIGARQSYALAAPLGGALFLGRAVGWRRGLALLGLVLGGSLILVGLLQALTGGFVFHVVLANLAPWEGARVLYQAREMGRGMPLLLLGAGLGGFRLCRRGGAGAWLVLGFGLGALLSALTVGKIGSNVNYLLEWSVALCLALGLVFVKAGATGGRRLLAGIVLPLLLVAQLGGMVRWFQRGFWPERAAKLAWSAEVAQLDETVRAAAGEVLADEYLALLPLAGRPIPLEPFAMRQLAVTGRWDERPLVAKVMDRSYPVVLLYDPPDFDSFGERWPPRTAAALRQRYRPTQRLAGTLVLVPAR